MIDVKSLETLLNNHKSEFEAYSGLLLKWNKTYNLTAITSPNEIWVKHFLDSVTPLKFLSKTNTLLDIGSGAGFPGIPLKIVIPDIAVTLLEASRKRCNFCETVIREIGLKNIKVVHGRAESADIQKEIGKFDAVISRAVWSLKDFTFSASAFLKDEQSIIIAMKGDKIDNEIRGVERTAKIEEYQLPGSTAKRNIIILACKFLKLALKGA